ncbi:cation-transporting P-type ATPase [Acidithiobacillus sp.]|jgi:H+-transporting ATPase|uniref:cation-transporting P-type ATPase n=1 Tax=Acidithiobacillus sp. TaxID=1872118 RepID=UPI0025C6D76D|nr:cation-transporting P-type ATPase [Acidithiobacillus sp.]MCK9188163.1 cation-transporting P-type ATPase [Acidithiobacillus sp.]MCK9360313.1 cation-transporting P-type ATPase [Acidithiobacillus sp.]
MDSISSTETDKTPPIEQTLADLHTSSAGMTGSEAQQRLQQYGANALQEKIVSLLMHFLHYFCGPIAWMDALRAAVLALCG